MKVLIIAALVLLFSVAAFAQAKASDGKAIVYFYANRTHTTPGQVRKPVFMDGEEIADIRPAKYFIVLVEPGKHSFHMKKKSFGGVEMVFEAGKTYYIRLEWRQFAKIGTVGIAPPENVAFDLKQLQPVDQKNIKNAKIVVLGLP